MNLTKRRTRKDIIIRRTVSAFGGGVLLMLLVLVWHLFSQALPVMSAPTLEPLSKIKIPADIELLSVDNLQQGQLAVANGRHCELVLLQMRQDRMVRTQDYRRPCAHELGTLEYLGQTYLTDISVSGLVRVEPLRADQNSSYVEHQPVSITSTPTNTAQGLSFAVDPTIWGARTAWKVELSERWVVLQVDTPDSHRVLWVNRKQPTKVHEQQFELAQQLVILPGTEQVLLVNGKSAQFFDLQSQLIAKQSFSQPIKWTKALPKHRSILMLDASAQLWRLAVRNAAGTMLYERTYATALQPDEVPYDIAVDSSSNAMAVLTSKQRILLMNRVSGEIVVAQRVTQRWKKVSWRSDLLFLFDERQIATMKVSNIAGVMTWDSLFSPQVYEGYLSADTLWQTSSASDYYEAKMSLVPLLIGSLKASLLALAIAVPLAVGAAIYTGFFVSPAWRHNLKPTIEMLEAVPSVLIGFIAAVWLAPMTDRFLFTLALMLVILPLGLIAFSLAQRKIKRHMPIHLRKGNELVVITVIVFVVGLFSMLWIADAVAGWFEVQRIGELINFAQAPIEKTTIVVAIALGIAISPSIYSLAEDAISGVPASLQHASYALGATRLQTLHGVVVRVAMPGIIAALMLGFGRAFGETMIVLMVTGNTPVSSWSLFEGLRSLTANLAIELPEADVQSVHYRILFVTACVLFAFTFCINTLAEIMRRRMRRRMYLE